jgi:hypothetical protein
MQTLRRFFTQHRLQRAILWTLAVLAWMQTAVFGDRDISWRHARQRRDVIWLPGLTRFVRKLLMARAIQLARLRPRRQILYWRYGRDQRRAHFHRSVIGSMLRKATRRGPERAWIARLMHVLRNIDTYAAVLARRLRRGHARLWRSWGPIAAEDAICAPPAVPPACADSS